jgi:hypothetical protein
MKNNIYRCDVNSSFRRDAAQHTRQCKQAKRDFPDDGLSVEPAFDKPVLSAWAFKNMPMPWRFARARLPSIPRHGSPDQQRISYYPARYRPKPRTDNNGQD